MSTGRNAGKWSRLARLARLAVASAAVVAAISAVACDTTPPVSSRDQGAFDYVDNLRVKICHRTLSETNPWVLIEVSEYSLGAHWAHGDRGPDNGDCPAGPGSGGDDGGTAASCDTVSFSLLSVSCSQYQVQLTVTGSFAEAPAVTLDGEPCDGGVIIEEAENGQSVFSYLCTLGEFTGGASIVTVSGDGIDCEDEVVTGCTEA